MDFINFDNMDNIKIKDVFKIKEKEEEKDKNNVKILLNRFKECIQKENPNISTHKNEGTDEAYNFYYTREQEKLDFSVNFYINSSENLTMEKVNEKIIKLYNIIKDKLESEINDKNSNNDASFGTLNLQKSSRIYISKSWSGEKNIADLKKWAVKKMIALYNIIDEPYKSLKNTTGDIEPLITLLEKNKNLVLTGVPGAGKTYLAKQIAMQMIFGSLKDEKDLSEEEKKLWDKHYHFVQFHPSYDYTDFVEGIKPSEISEGVKLDVRDGVLKTFCKEALKACVDNDKGELNQEESNNFVFIIDEINRADLSRVFGELFFGLEADYRGKEITTQYSYLQDGKKLVIPRNLYIIGTMNNIDRSVESMDFALRRRFVWKEITAESSKTIIDSAKISDELKNQAKGRMDKLNTKILEIFGSTAYQIGGAYFKKLELYDESDKSFNSLWENHLENVLREYLRGDRKLEDKLKDLKAAYDNEQSIGSAE